MTGVRAKSEPAKTASGLSARRLLIGLPLALAAASGCGDGDVASPQGAKAEAVSEGAPAAPTADAGDPLLAQARASIAGGRIDPGVAAKIRASTDPAHARAARLLAAFEGEPVPGSAAQGEAAAPAVTPPVVAVAPEAEAEAEAGAEAARADHARAEGTLASPAPASSGTPATPRRAKPRPELSGLTLAKRDGGARLTIKAPGGVTVGVANQPSSGIVRLVIEGASATPRVVGARPKIAGARVSGVRKGQDTVQITLQLDPGWTLGGVKSFSGGARVDLVAP